MFTPNRNDNWNDQRNGQWHRQNLSPTQPATTGTSITNIMMTRHQSPMPNGNTSLLDTDSLLNTLRYENRQLHRRVESLITSNILLRRETRNLKQEREELITEHKQMRLGTQEIVAQIQALDAEVEDLAAANGRLADENVRLRDEVESLHAEFDEMGEMAG
ncbi:uncharacterized protein K452DRAFT_335177 [Aplosporella prunicola CBS 121167]|uniref:Autophagy-related protein 16 domain-containing protein n=1 Tax=Aplosporella prunicola CBS 121167 TaxID=1176127 RepID=A0A6A6AUB1_9PEZI|nr:uncharacterized protein K452DRAFT_335177 [Aplosporella prunicola CBS 121167]KAF2135186.1 hypothetical protein K452DRAFT_335177 [Aplosporella prunicola CBS 121167]